MPSVKPRPKRLQNVILSAGLCTGLLVAYYVLAGNTEIPPDLHITYESRGCEGDCPTFRLDVTADGAAAFLDPRGQTHRSVLSKYAVRHLMRAFARQHFLGRSVTGYVIKPGAAVCDLTLSENHQKTSIRHACETTVPEIAQPVVAMERATQFRAFLSVPQNH